MGVDTERYTLKELVYFAKTAECEGIKPASEKLSVTSSSLSKAIQRLEEEWGMKLFVRHRARGMTLTTNGEKLLREIHDILQRTSQLTESVKMLAKTANRTLSIGCIPTFAQIVFPSFRKEYEKKHPFVQVQQFELDQNEIIKHLRQSKIEIALTYDFAVPADLEFIPLLDLPPHVVVSESHELANYHEVRIKELGKYPMVLLDMPLLADYVLSLFKKKSAFVNIAECTKDPASRMCLVADDFGYSIINFKPVSTQWLNGKSLKFIPLANPHRILKMGLMIPNGGASSKIVQSFIDHSSNMIKSGLLPELNI